MSALSAPSIIPTAGTGARRKREVVAGGSLLAGFIHLGVCPQHFREATVFGLFFLTVAVLQVTWAASVAKGTTARTLALGAAGHLAVAVIWAETRLVGLPFGLGTSGAGTAARREPVGVLDVVATVVELAVAYGALNLISDRTPTADLARRMRSWLPAGSPLPDDVWAQRHRWILILLSAHIPFLFLFALARHTSVLYAVVASGLITCFPLLAVMARQHRRLTTIVTAIGLLTCSAMLVRLSGGVIEMHFHYFVMVGVITLYQDWWPFLVAIAYVVLQHGLAGVIDPTTVYNHPEAIREPWRWAAIHGLFILGMSSTGIASWRLNESFLAGTIQEIGERKAAEDELRGTLSLLSATLDATADGILVVDASGSITSFNHKFVEIWRLPDEVLATRNDDDALAFVLSQVADAEAFLGKVRELYASPEAESYDVIDFKDGRTCERFSTPQRVGGVAVGRVWSFRDVTERKRLEGELAHQAFHDPLTSLANQALFRDRVDHALARASRLGSPLAVLFLDLDDFKTVNDSLGHTAGDELLKAVAGRIEECLRVIDTAARLGGDEFAILVEDAADDTEVTAIAERLIASFEAPFMPNGREMFVTASIGIAFDRPGDTSDHLLRNADLAMYTAKRHGKARYAIYQSTMHTAAVDRLELEADLRRGLGRGELVVAYQPIVELATDEVVGVEALVRWNHPERGLLAPSAFIPMAEETGLIREVGRQVLAQACAQTRQWQQAFPDSRLRSVSVNVSPHQLHHESLMEHVGQALAHSGLPAHSLVLEITETAMMNDTGSTIRKLKALKSIGIRLAVDDFGTGYSSLSYLQRFPVDILKIDQAFVAAITTENTDPSLVRAIVSIGQTLGLVSVAEGVENATQVEALTALGCQLAQGYLFARPLPADGVTELLARSSRSVGWREEVTAG